MRPPPGLLGQILGPFFFFFFDARLQERSSGLYRGRLVDVQSMRLDQILLTVHAEPGRSGSLRFHPSLLGLRGGVCGGAAAPQSCRRRGESCTVAASSGFRNVTGCF